MKLGELDIKKAYFGIKELTSNNAYIGTIPIIKDKGIPNDEIWYTSLDENIVTPYDTSVLPEIDTNTYNDGKGIIKFKTDVTIIGKSAFAECSSLTSVIISNSVTSIGNNAFSKCTGLTSVMIGNNVTNIGNNAFYNCISLTSIIIPNSVTNIGNAFNSCSSLTSVMIDSDVIINKTYTISSNIREIFGLQVTNCVIGNSVTGIGNYAFYANGNLTSVIIPNSVISIGNHAFDSCNNLTSVTIPDSVTSIGEYAFAYIPAKISFSKLYSTYTNKIFNSGIGTNTIYNVEFNISEIPTNYNISSILKQIDDTGKYTLTYNIYTDYAPCKDQALALANQKTIVNVYHIDGTPW